MSTKSKEFVDAIHRDIDLQQETKIFLVKAINVKGNADNHKKEFDCYSNWVGANSIKKENLSTIIETIAEFEAKTKLDKILSLSSMEKKRYKYILKIIDVYFSYAMDIFKTL